MNENLDLTQILFHCPKGTKLYSPIFGEVEFQEVSNCDCITVLAFVKTRYNKLRKEEQVFHYDGTYWYRGKDAECCLFPSKDCRDWSKFVVPKEDLKIGVFVAVSDDGVNWSVSQYNGKGYAYSISTTTESFKYIIPIKICIREGALTVGDIHKITITDENNYGKSYWDKFKED